jgi:hypothetical protein
VFLLLRNKFGAKNVGHVHTLPVTIEVDYSFEKEQGCQIFLGTIYQSGGK